MSRALKRAGFTFDRFHIIQLANKVVDEDGDLILDEITLAFLRQAFRGLKNAGPDTLDELRLYVKAGLTGETGADGRGIERHA